MPSQKHGPSATPLFLTLRELNILQQIVSARKTDQGLALRAQIVLDSFHKRSNSRIAQKWHISRTTVTLWRDRYAQARSKLQCVIEKKVEDAELRDTIEEILSDAPRPGTPARITPEQKIAIIALACEPLPQLDVPQSQWDGPALAREAVRRGIVTEISPSWVLEILRQADIHPHKMKY